MMRFNMMRLPHPKLDEATEKRGWEDPTGFFPYFTTEALDEHMAAVEHPTALDTFMNDAVSWCKDQFGDQKHWALVGLDILFERRADATAFKIRWC